jgi:hypothetical protein
VLTLSFFESSNRVWVKRYFVRPDLLVLTCKLLCFVVWLVVSTSLSIILRHSYLIIVKLFLWSERHGFLLSHRGIFTLKFWCSLCAFIFVLLVVVYLLLILVGSYKNEDGLFEWFYLLFVKKLYLLLYLDYVSDERMEVWTSIYDFIQQSVKDNVYIANETHSKTLWEKIEFLYAL